MSDIAIRVEGLSKQYRIGGPQVSYKTLRESLVGAVQSPVRRAGRLLRGEAATDHQETIWALKDVSFEVKHGEVLGIIGRNGAGKSTLLKVLSRITAPTEGTVDLYGRVGSLLEVGTGFHPELTGRENIYLNGAILGMKRAEIDQKFDEIVAFAELEKFLDTPVKHYSSGMYVRLAFAVAAHLDPEILMVDEVLAVGDSAFQKKCLNKIESFREAGGTALFVSHNTQVIVHQCERSLLLVGGALVANSDSKAVADLYHRMLFGGPQTSVRGPEEYRSTASVSNSASSPEEVNLRRASLTMDQKAEYDQPERSTDRPTDWLDLTVALPPGMAYGSGAAQIFEYGLYNESGEQINVATMGQRCEWRYMTKFMEDVRQVCFGFLIRTQDGLEVAGSNALLEGKVIHSIPAGSVVETVFRFRLNLAPATYYMNAGVRSLTRPPESMYLHRRVDLYSFRVIPCDSRKTHGHAFVDSEFRYRLVQGT